MATNPFNLTPDDIGYRTGTCVRVDSRAPHEEHREQVLNALTCIEGKADYLYRQLIAFITAQEPFDALDVWYWGDVT